jgi:hypothetical protein
MVLDMRYKEGLSKRGKSLETSKIDLVLEMEKSEL